MDDEDLPLSVLVKLEDLNAAGIERDIMPSKEQIEAMKSALNLLSLDSFKFTGQLRLAAPNRIDLRGRLEVTVVQECVITLEPVESRIKEDISIEFMPAKAVAELERQAEEEGIAIPIDGPEPLPEKAIDIGHIAFEHLSAALDPYPRKEDATFNWNDPSADGDSREAHPFAELEKLKNKR